jgi:hypothetical protein
MSQWTDRYKSHAIWGRLSTLGSAIDQAAQRDGIEAATVDDVERLRVVLSLSGKRLAGADPALIQIPPLDELAAALQNAENELMAFVTDGNAGHIRRGTWHAPPAGYPATPARIRRRPRAAMSVALLALPMSLE